MEQTTIIRGFTQTLNLQRKRHLCLSKGILFFFILILIVENSGATPGTTLPKTQMFNNGTQLSPSAISQPKMVKKGERLEKKGEYARACDLAIDALNCTVKNSDKFTTRAKALLHRVYPKVIAENEISQVDLMRADSVFEGILTVERRKEVYRLIMSRIQLHKKVNSLPEKFLIPGKIPSGNLATLKTGLNSSLKRLLEAEELAATHYYQHTVDYLNNPNSSIENGLHAYEAAKLVVELKGMQYLDIARLIQQAKAQATLTICVVRSNDEQLGNYVSVIEQVLVGLKREMIYQLQKSPYKEHVKVVEGDIDTQNKLRLSINVLEIKHRRWITSEEPKKLTKEIKNKDGFTSTAIALVTEHHRHAGAIVRVELNASFPMGNPLISNDIKQTAYQWSDDYASYTGSNEAIKGTKWIGLVNMAKYDTYPPREKVIAFAADKVGRYIYGQLSEIINRTQP